MAANELEERGELASSSCTLSRLASQHSLPPTSADFGGNVKQLFFGGGQLRQPFLTRPLPVKQHSLHNTYLGAYLTHGSDESSHVGEADLAFFRSQELRLAAVVDRIQQSCVYFLWT